MMRLQAQGISLEQYFQMQGTDPAEFTAELRNMAGRGVRADLALRAVAVAETLEADDTDVEMEFARLAERSGQKAKDIRKAYERNEAIGSLRQEIRKRKALDWLVEHCEIVDPAGNPIDRAALNPAAADDDSDSEESAE